MTQTLSPNTQAILLLTAPLITGRGSASSDLLSPGEYKRLARRLREIQRQPADLVSQDADEVLRACQPVIDESRLQRLLGRGFLLSQVIERWQARAIWVVSRADADYPRRLKARLREDAPAVIYGCGEMSLLDSGGLAVVGSRRVDDVLIDYTIAVGRLAARSGRTIVSGGAKGIDQSAMRGALEAGGIVVGVLAENLERSVMDREQRNRLLDGSLTLISAYDPSAGFNVGHALQRNKLIYALADISLVVNSDLNKGGTWAGAVEQLDKLKFVPVFVRSTGEPSTGLDALRKKGAIPWPDPQDVASFESVFKVSLPTPAASPQVGFVLSTNDAPSDAGSTAPLPLDAAPVPLPDNVSPTAFDALPEAKSAAESTEELPPAMQDPTTPVIEVTEVEETEWNPTEFVFAAVREAVQLLASKPMKEAEIAAALGVSNAQAKTWLQRLVDEGVLEKRKKPVGYIVKQKRLFE